MNLRSKLKPYQNEGVDFLLSHLYVILAYDPGLGKSLTALASTLELKGNTLIVCPAYLRENWKLEILKWLPNRTIDVHKSTKTIFYPYDANYVVIGFDQLSESKDLFKWADNVIVDEVHNFFNAETARTNNLYENLDLFRPKSLYMLSGTPIKNRVSEFYILLLMASLCPGKCNGVDVAREYLTFESFADEFSYQQTRYVGVKKYGRTFKKKLITYTGIKNEAKLKKLLQGKYLRKKAEDVLDIQKILFKPVYISDKVFPNIEQEFEYFLDSENSSSLNIKNKTRSALFKVKYTIDYAENLLNETAKIIIYSHHREPVYQIAEHFKVSAITGEMPSDRRFKVVQDWKDGKFRVLVATIGALSTGVNLTESNHIIMNDKSWVEADNIQAYGRVNRIGQTGVPTIHEIFYGPQDEKISRLVSQKRNISNKCLN